MSSVSEWIQGLGGWLNALDAAWKTLISTLIGALVGGGYAARAAKVAARAHYAGQIEAAERAAASQAKIAAEPLGAGRVGYWIVTGRTDSTVLCYCGVKPMRLGEAAVLNLSYRLDPDRSSGRPAWTPEAKTVPTTSGYCHPTEAADRPTRLRGPTARPAAERMLAGRSRARLM